VLLDVDGTKLSELSKLDEEQETVKVRTAPRVLTRDGLEAVVAITRLDSYIAGYDPGTSDVAPEPKFKYDDVGVVLKVTAKYRDEDADIDLYLHFEETDPAPPRIPDATSTMAGESGVNIYRLSPRLTVRSGQPVILVGPATTEDGGTRVVLAVTATRPEADKVSRDAPGGGDK
jgi:type II secretory pathway component GspD/PulD (secretin)